MVRSILCLVMLSASGFAQVEFPSTPAGRQLAAWFEALNSGDRTSIEYFTQEHLPGWRPGFMLAVNTQTSGLDAQRIETSGPNHIVAIARERGPRKQIWRIALTVAPDATGRITDVRLQPAEQSTALPERKMTPQEAEAARRGAPFLQFSAWLEAFNSADSEQLARFAEKAFPSMNVDMMAGFQRQTGGFDLYELERGTPTALSGLIKERESDQYARFVIEVEPAEPHRIARLPINAIPHPEGAPRPAMTERELIAALRTKLEKDAASGRFSGSVMLAKNDVVLFSGAYGLSDREHQVPNRVDTRFRIGSMNKMFTAVAMLQLAQAGKLKLSDPVGKYIKDYPNREIADKVTIHHLLTHTGGTGDIFGPEFDSHRLDLKTLEDYVKLYGARAPEFEPGSRFAYSNYGMILAGVVIERVSGESYYACVEKHIFGPAGMNRTGSQPESESVADRAVGYMLPRDGGGWRPNTDTLGVRGTSAGGGYSTVVDLIQFVKALQHHRLLSAEYTALLTTGKVEAFPGVRYAYGFEDGRKNGTGAFGHGGGAPGMNGDLRVYPKSGYVVAVLSNLDPPAARRISQFIDLRLPE